MKIIVFSDSHGRLWDMKRIIEEERPDLLLHLGDYDTDCGSSFEGCRVLQVKGNCDYDSAEEEERFLDFGETKIWLTHGHRYGVKQGIEALVRAGCAKGASIILYGHTHRAYLQETAAYAVLNPGTPLTSYGKIELENGKLKKIALMKKEP